MTIRRRATCVAALFIATMPAFAQSQVKVSAGHRAAPDGAVRLQGPIATIRITAWARDSVAVVGSLASGATFADATDTKGATARNVQFVITGPPGQVRPAGTIELRVPAGARVVVHSGSSDIEATGLTGELSIDMLGGTARVTASPRILAIDAIYAAITLDGSPGRVHLKSFEGDITMRGSSPDAEFSTAKGNITVGGGIYERATFDATSGSVTFNGSLAPNAVVSITTHSAPVDLALNPKANLVIEATTSFGTIQNVFDKQEPLTGKDGKSQLLNTQTGKGTAHVTVDSYRGNVRITRRFD